MSLYLDPGHMRTGKWYQCTKWDRKETNSALTIFFQKTKTHTQQTQTTTVDGRNILTEAESKRQQQSRGAWMGLHHSAQQSPTSEPEALM